MYSSVLRPSRWLLAAVLTLTMVFADPAAAQYEERFTFQGRLVNAQGVPVPNGPRTLAFRLYRTGDPASPVIHTETQQVTVRDGLFTAHLGAVNPLPVMHGAVWVGVQVQGEAAEMVPRLPIYPPPVAAALRHLRTEPGGTVGQVNIIGGPSTNTVTAGVDGAVVLGGSASVGFHNRVTDNHSTVSGGVQNQAGNGNVSVTDSGGATVSGGFDNTASGSNAAVGGGSLNEASGPASTVAGGNSNRATATGATVAGGISNHAEGGLSLAAGHQARAMHVGSFVWSHSIGGSFASTAPDQFSIRARNGVRVSESAGDSKVVAIGERYRDNGIVAWACVAASGTIRNDYGVLTVTREGPGAYLITLNATTSSPALLVPVASAELDAPPTSAGTARIISVNQHNASSVKVYITNGSYVPVDNDFTLLITGR